MINELWELKNAGVVTKNGPSGRYQMAATWKMKNVGEMPASRVIKMHLTEALGRHGPQTADEQAALFGVTSRKVASTLAMATKKSRAHRIAKDGKYRYCLPN